MQHAWNPIGSMGYNSWKVVLDNIHMQMQQCCLGEVYYAILYAIMHSKKWTASDFQDYASNFLAVSFQKIADGSQQ